MATPHVAGYAAYLLGLDSSLTPASVDTAIKSKALNGVLTGIRKHCVHCAGTALLTTFSSLRHRQPPPQQRSLRWGYYTSGIFIPLFDCTGVLFTKGCTKMYNKMKRIGEP